MRIGIRELIFFGLLSAMPMLAYFWPGPHPVYGLKAQNVRIAEARAEIAAKQQKLAALEVATRRIDDLGQEIEKLSQAIVVFEQKLPAEREVEVILREVWELAAKNRLIPRSVRTDRPVAAAQYAELPIRMVIIGDFDGFYSFLLELEKLPRITQTRRMQLKKIASPEAQMQAELTLSIFFESLNDVRRDRL
jgi:type IV pilus assembly protein PilO